MKNSYLRQAGRRPVSSRRRRLAQRARNWFARGAKLLGLSGETLAWSGLLAALIGQAAPTAKRRI